MRQMIVGIFPLFKAAQGPVPVFFSRTVNVRSLLLALILIFGLIFGTSLPSRGQIEDRQNFDISAQPLSTALLDFAAQANLSLLVRKQDTKGKKSPGLKGDLYPKEALDLLLEGTGLGFEYIDSRTISVSSDLYRPVTVSTGQQVPPVAEDDEDMTGQPVDILATVD